MSALKFALVVTFSIIGSSLLSILAYFLIARYRKRRQQRREFYARAMNEKLRSEDSEGRPSLSDFPFPANRKTWASQHGGSERSGPRSTQFPIQGPTRKTWSGKSEDNSAATEIDVDDEQPKPSLSRKNTLTYDPTRPDEPPRFRSWLDENFKNVIATESPGEEEKKSKKMEKDGNGKPVIGTAY
jgi:type II secretory pathway pseudopilin PulG